MSRSPYRLLGVALLCPSLAFGNGKPSAAGTFFNTCAFVEPQPGSFGSVSLNTLRGPRYKNWDGSLQNFPLGESCCVEFRAEFYNLPNHTNYLFAAGQQNANNSTVLGTSSFGYVTAARPPRQMQLGLKIYY